MTNDILFVKIVNIIRTFEPNNHNFVSLKLKVFISLQGSAVG